MASMHRLSVKIGLLAATLALLALVAVAWFYEYSPQPIRNPQPLRDAERRVYSIVRSWMKDDQLARPDGAVKTVEIGQLLVYSAMVGDREFYQLLRDFCVAHLIQNNPSDPFTQGMVAWCYRPKLPPDASGTTEALRVAQGLWLGSAAFHQPQDRELALLIIGAYARHADDQDQGQWMIRNYCNLQTRAWATNSFLVDYDPDFISEVAQATGDPELKKLAGNSYALIQKARTPAGLIYDLVQPEIATLTNARLMIFSPNDMAQLSNVLTVAERVMKGDPATARRVLDFATKRAGNLNLYYYCRTGEWADTKACGAETYGPLVRLAVGLNAPKALDLFLPHLLLEAQGLSRDATGDRVYLASEMLMALHAAAGWIEKTNADRGINPQGTGRSAFDSAPAPATRPVLAP
jgi:hypothetical protein